jgi:ribonuclease R
MTRDKIIKFMKHPDYRPMRRVPLAQALTDDEDEQRDVGQLLRQLVRDGLIVQLKKKGYAIAEAADLVAGRISFAKSGVAFVKAADSDTDIFIPPRRTSTAFPGDRVLVRIERNPRRRRDGDSLEGTVIRILERNQMTIVGTLKRQRRIYYVEPMRATISTDVLVADTGGANLGDRVLVALDEWEDPRVNPEGEIIEVIGPADDPALDTISVMKSYELEPHFPPHVVAEAEGASIDESAIAGRLDYRKKFVFTIDPASARDFDDAISLETVHGGGWRLGIHIADVSHFVRLGMELDKEAIKRATSVYLPDQVVPMLPEQLSNGLCSLKPNVDRLAFSAIVTLDAQCNVVKAKFAETVIHSKMRLTYEQALEALRSPDGAAFPELGASKRTVELLKTCNQIAQTLRQRRFNDGALNMELPEVRFNIGDDGRIAGITPVEHDESHQLIEEFMLLANETVCRELSRRKIPHVHRIHDAPDPEKLGELQEMFLIAGIEVGNLCDRHALSDVLSRIAKEPQAHAWNMAVLRSMKKAEYATKAIGHFGLAKFHYDHFTSPIRRYPDLIIHRILKAVLSNAKPVYRNQELDELSMHCSEREQIAVAAEREVTDLKRLRYFAEQIEKGELEEFDAVVTDVRNFGIMVDLPRIQAYGMIHVSSLDDDFYDYNPMRQEMKGRHNQVAFGIGTTLKVVVARVDMDKRMLDFAPVLDTLAGGSGLKPPRKPAKKGKGKKEKNKHKGKDKHGRDKHRGKNRGGKRRH